MLISPDQELVKIKMVGVCRDCKHYHPLHAVTPSGFSAEVMQWAHKHEGHDFDYFSVTRNIPKGFDDREFEKAGRAPWWLDYKPNADLKIAYGSSAAITITLSSLASSSTWVAGRESAVQDNTTNKYVAGLVTGKIMTGTTPTADTIIRIHAYQVLDDTPTYPVNFTGSDAAITLTNTYNLETLAYLGASGVSATSNVSYSFTRLMNLEEAFGIHPAKWGLYIAHNTAVNLHATGSNHVLTYKGAYFTSI